MNIDYLKDLDDDTRKEIEALQKITREENGDEIFAQRNYNLGITLMRLNHNDLALSYFDKIKIIDDKLILSKSFLHTGFIYETIGELDKAIKYWGMIKKEYGVVIYSVAQLYVGYYYSISDKVELAINAWNTIKKDYNLDLYNQAQFNLGVAYGNKGDHKSSKNFWINIERGESIDLYISAQFNLGYDYDIEGNYEKALEIWDSILSADSPKFYARAQYNIGKTYENIKDYESAMKAFENVKLTDDPEIYAVAQYQIGLFLIHSDISENFNEAKQVFTNAQSAYPYEVYCYDKICELLLKPETKNVGKQALLLLEGTLKTVSILKLDFGQASNEIKPAERKLAHYTSTYITNLLLETDKDNSLPSFFRLNTINNVNDPSEGRLLVNYLKDIQVKYFYAPDFDKNLHAFISCFTFNHDSLNQFRLYGKESDKEASGVSLVFKKEFFQSNNSIGGLSFLSLDNSIQKSYKEFPVQSINKQSNINQKHDSKIIVKNQPVMRCVYIDPTSNYIQLAQRNRLTFFREFINEVVEVEGEKTSKAEHEWNRYKKYIDEKTEIFNDAFISLKGTYKLIIEEKIKIKKDSTEVLENIAVLLDEILLPLKYLIKHSAFQEEQECRMVYVTSLNAPEVKMEHKRFLFVEYEAGVKQNLNKIYIAPAATEYQLYLAWLLRNSDAKIELSNNPYRQT
ncbi:tetratricopeptide repeat protein [Psychrobacter frigidicola]|uniref:Tetratricopeptide repeat protein n=1 Tax=Psychrobacter frigidicola TaxID=45611 RepID=A0A5C7A1H6_9GAMM|nr:tetratricopeptide repeat protein [Psychrobacter frigidicola]TXD97096.1 tetratricopeptide repeat protein [Psychrobacter frigidicola]